MNKKNPYHKQKNGSKALAAFEKYKRLAEQMNKSKGPDPVLGQSDEDFNFQQLNRDAVKSLHILPEVVKTERGFEVV